LGEIEGVTPNAKKGSGFLELRELSGTRREQDVAHAKFRTDCWQLWPRRLAAVNRHNDPVFSGDCRNPHFVARTRRKAVEYMKEADLVAVKRDQVPQRLGEWPSKALIEEELRRLRVHAAVASDS